MKAQALMTEDTPFALKTVREHRLVQRLERATAHRACAVVAALHGSTDVIDGHASNLALLSRDSRPKLDLDDDHAASPGTE